MTDTEQLIFASKPPHGLSHDPWPYVDESGMRWYAEEGVCWPETGPNAGQVHEWSAGLRHDPRPEYEHTQHNEANPVLVAFRADCKVTHNWPVSIFLQDWINVLDGYGLSWESCAVDLDDMLDSARPAHIDHARRVISRLAAHDGPEYTLCAVGGCPFFVERNTDADDADPAFPLAAYLHLTRGDAADDAREDHEAVPGESHTLAWWRAHGPERVRERFIAAPA